MILVDWQIREGIEKGWIKIDPFKDDQINPASYDIRLNGEFFEVHPKGEHGYIDPTDKESFETVKYKFKGKYLLQPGNMVLASLVENITLPDFICAQIIGKSSIGRLGVGNSEVAGFADNNWSGILTIELFNHSNYPILLTHNMKIGQIVFHHTESVEKGYDKTGRYQNQKPGQGSLGCN